MKKILFCLLGIVAFIGCSKNEMHKTYVDTTDRPDYLQNLIGVWEASAEDGQRFEYVIINNNSIMMYPRDVAGESYSQPIKGVYAHDQHALYVTVMNHRHSGEKNEELPRKITIPYTMSADVTFTTGTLTLELDGRIISLVKKRGWPNARRRQSLLDGEWKSVKARKEATDMSMTVCFSEEALLVTIEGETFAFDFLGSAFYEQGMMYVVKDDCSDYEEDEDFSALVTEKERRFDTAADYARYHALPEYVFFAAMYDTPYRALLRYHLRGDTLTLFAYDKKIVLKKSLM